MKTAQNINDMSYLWTSKGKARQKKTGAVVSVMLGKTASNSALLDHEGREDGQQERCQGQIVKDLLCQAKELSLYPVGHGGAKSLWRTSCSRSHNHIFTSNTCCRAANRLDCTNHRLSDLLNNTSP